MGLPKKLGLTKSLKTLYKSGEMDDVLKKYNKYINPKNHYSSGTQVSTYVYNKEWLYKLCSKKGIHYFDHFKTTSARSFQQLINHYPTIFESVDEIVYENSHLFVYRQRRLEAPKRRHKKNYTKFQLASVIDMINSGAIITDIGRHNIGCNHDRYLYFDCHGIFPLQMDGDQIIGPYGWEHRLIKNLQKSYPSISSVFYNSKTKTELVENLTNLL